MNQEELNNFKQIKLDKYINSNSEFQRPLILNIISGDQYNLRLTEYWSVHHNEYYPLVLETLYKGKVVKKYNLLCMGNFGFYITNEDLDRHFNIMNSQDRLKMTIDTEIKMEPLYEIYYYGEKITDKLYKQVEELANKELNNLNKNYSNIYENKN